MRDGLHLDFCSHEAAKYAVMRWHYSRKMPKSKLVRIGVWEDEKFRGAIIYGLGANRHLSRPFGLEDTEVCELVRVALAPGRNHPTSQCVGDLAQAPPPSVPRLEAGRLLRGRRPGPHRDHLPGGRVALSRELGPVLHQGPGQGRAPADALRPVRPERAVHPLAPAERRPPRLPGGDGPEAPVRHAPDQVPPAQARAGGSALPQERG